MGDFHPSVARISPADGRGVLGAGFLVAPDLLATCAHVLGNEADPVQVCFPQAEGSPVVIGRLVPGTWRAPEAEDVAFLRLEPVPAGVPVLGLRSAAGALGAELRTFGFPAQAPLDGHPGTAEVGQRFTSAGISLLALTEANALAQGFSGGPVVDADGLVVGMVTAHPGADPYNRGIDLAYATPAVVLRQIGPDLEIEQDCPYPGLVPFTSEQAPWFHGRDHVVEALVDRLRERRGVLALFGSSGSGKSSLVAAGLLPALARGAVPEVTAGSQRILRAGADRGAVISALRKLRSSTGPRPELLIIDQFEELLTHPQPDRPETAQPDPFTAETSDPTAGDPATRVLDELVRIAAGDDSSRVLLVLRDDFFPRFSSRSPALMDHLLQGRIVNLTDELTPAALRDIIVTPAQDQGWNVDPLLTDRLIRDLVDQRTRTAPVTDLPVLALTLHRIWLTATASPSASSSSGSDRDNTLTLEHYDSVGGVRTAFATWCDQAYRTIPTALQPAARTLVTALVQDPDLGQGTPAVRRRRTVADLTLDDEGRPDNNSVEALEYLTDARIVTTNRDPVTGAVLVELAHDTVIEHWQALHAWLEDDRDQRRWLDRTEDRARHWDETGRRSGLLEDEELAEATRRRASTMPDVVAAYLRASRLQQRARALTRAGALLAMVALTVLSLVAAGIAVSRNAEAGRQRQEATRQQGEALRQRDVAIGNQVLDSGHQLQASDPSLAVQLELVGHRLSPSLESAAGLSDLARSPLSSLRPGSSRTLVSVAISADGLTLATGDIDTTIQLSRSADPLHPIVLGPPLTGRTGWVSALAFSPDGSILAAGSDDGTLRLWSLADPAHPALIGKPQPGSDGAILALAFSRDGTALASGEEGAIRLLDVSDPGRPVRRGRLASDDGPVDALAFSPDGRTLAEGGDHLIQLWNLSDRTHAVPLSRPDSVNRGAVDSLSFSPDGRLLAAGSGSSGDDNPDSEIRLWDVTSLKHPARRGPVLTGHTVSFGPDSATLAAGDDDGTIQRWTVTQPKHPALLGQPLAGHVGTVYATVFGPGSRTLTSVGEDGALRRWTLTSTDYPSLLGPALTGHKDIVAAVAFSPDGSVLASGSNDGTIRLQDPTRSGIPDRKLKTTNDNQVNTVAFSPDGRTLAGAGSDQKIRLWNLTGPAGPALLGTPLTGPKDAVETLAFNPAGTVLAAAGDDKAIRLWNVAHPVPLGQPLTGHKDIVESLAFSPDGMTLASGSDDASVRLWDVRDPTHPVLLATLQREIGAASIVLNEFLAVAFSPDGNTLAGVDLTGTIRLWDVTDPAHPVLRGRPLTNPNGTLYSVAFSPDSRTLAVATDASIRRWDLTDPAHPTPLGRALSGHTDAVESVAFSPDGRLLASGSDDTTVRLWDLDVTHAIDLICAGTDGNLTPEQWQRYVPQLPYDPPCRHYRQRIR